MKLNAFIKKYDGEVLEDWGCVMSNDAKLFARDFKSVVKDLFKDDDISLVGWLVGHFFVSGFLKKGDRYVYFSRNIERYGKAVDVEGHSWRNEHILVRKAKSDKDYTGGSNNFSTLLGFKETVLRLF